MTDKLVFNLYINVDNDAFTPTPHAETARILREIAAKLESVSCDWYWYQTILDINGNDVGRAAFKHPERV